MAAGASGAGIHFRQAQARHATPMSPAQGGSDTWFSTAVAAANATTAATEAATHPLRENEW